MKKLNEKILLEDYMKEILQREPHNHEIIERDGILRWKENSSIRFLFDKNIIDLNHVVSELLDKGFDKNSEPYRQLYRDLGYSLYGYWEIFYWEGNNRHTLDYVYESVTGE